MFVYVYLDVVACSEKPVTNEVKARHSGAEVKPVGFREKVYPRDQFIFNDVGGILQVIVGVSHAATQQTLREPVIYIKTWQNDIQ